MVGWQPGNVKELLHRNMQKFTCFVVYHTYKQSKRMTNIKKHATKRYQTKPRIMIIYQLIMPLLYTKNQAAHAQTKVFNLSSVSYDTGLHNLSPPKCNTYPNFLLWNKKPIKRENKIRRLLKLAEMNIPKCKKTNILVLIRYKNQFQRS